MIAFQSRALSMARASRPALVLVPRCRWHPTIAPLPEQCADCRWWLDAQRAVADLDAVLAGDGA